MTTDRFSIIRRADDHAVLTQLIPWAREGTRNHQHLAMRFSVPAWKNLFIHYWQLESKGLVEFENKLREVGGKVGEDFPKSDPWPFATQDADPMPRDKTLLLCCINQKYQIMRVFEAVMPNPMSFDVKRLVQRQRHQAQDILTRLESVYAEYSSPEAGTPRSLVNPFNQPMMSMD